MIIQGAGSNLSYDFVKFGIVLDEFANKVKETSSAINSVNFQVLKQISSLSRDLLDSVSKFKESEYSGPESRKDIYRAYDKAWDKQTYQVCSYSPDLTALAESCKNIHARDIESLSLVEEAFYKESGLALKTLLETLDNLIKIALKHKAAIDRNKKVIISSALIYTQGVLGFFFKDLPKYAQYLVLKTIDENPVLSNIKNYLDNSIEGYDGVGNFTKKIFKNLTYKDLKLAFESNIFVVTPDYSDESRKMSEYFAYANFRPEDISVIDSNRITTKQIRKINHALRNRSDTVGLSQASSGQKKDKPRRGKTKNVRNKLTPKSSPRVSFIAVKDSEGNYRIFQAGTTQRQDPYCVAKRGRQVNGHPDIFEFVIIRSHLKSWGRHATVTAKIVKN